MSDEQDISTDFDRSVHADGDGIVRTYIPVGRAEAAAASTPANRKREDQVAAVPVEIGGRNGPDPTRFGDWELKGRCIDF